MRPIYVPSTTDHYSLLPLPSSLNPGTFRVLTAAAESEDEGLDFGEFETQFREAFIVPTVTLTLTLTLTLTRTITPHQYCNMNPDPNPNRKPKHNHAVTVTATVTVTRTARGAYSSL